MNYLAHLVLADDSDASRIGNLLGDFTKGTIASLAEIYPAEIIRGIKMHRAVDRFTDSHPVFKNTKLLLESKRRRFSGVIIDIIFDHHLSVHWQDYHHQPLESFIQDIYQAIDNHPEWQAGRLAEIFPSMKHENWLHTYNSIEGIALTLDRVSRRGKRTAQIADGIIDLRENYAQFEANFRTFMPSLLDFTDTWKKQH
ncbi:MAG: ACP phosphodiesterase [Akkermansiaceae bacterium]|nr:ACP phosphodiesterase [Akkermansiaceae bacterium]